MKLMIQRCNIVFTLYVVKILYKCQAHLFRDIYQKNI